MILPDLTLFPSGLWILIPPMAFGFWAWANGWHRGEQYSWDEWAEWEREFQDGGR